MNREEEVTFAPNFVNDFITHLVNESGQDLDVFTQFGFQQYLKEVGRKFYRMDIKGQALQYLFKLAKIFCDCTGINSLQVEKYLKLFLDMLQSIADFLVKNYLGRCVLFITAEMSSGLSAFIIFMYFAVLFVYKTVSGRIFLKLKEWVVWLTSSKEVKNFFETVFGTYGRTITYTAA